MTFDEAIELARLIRAREGWHVLRVSAQSGKLIEDDCFEVTAFTELDWGYVHYWCQPGSASEWARYAEVAEAGLQRRASSHRVDGRD